MRRMVSAESGNVYHYCQTCGAALCDPDDQIREEAQAA